MRKRTIKYLFEKTMWTILGFLPVIGYILYMLTFEKSAQGVTFNPNFDTFIKTAFGGLTGTESMWHYLYTAMADLFTTLGITSTDFTAVCFCFSWMILVELFHIIVDTLLFLPRVVKQFLVKAGEEE